LTVRRQLGFAELPNNDDRRRVLPTAQKGTRAKRACPVFPPEMLAFPAKRQKL
jgi:hypothetical protein